jgi:aminopeptidase N
MAYVGEERFTAGMRAYFAEHAWGSTTLQDLVDAISQASGRDLEAWRAGWLETAGPDRLSLERDADRFVLVAHGPDGAGPRPQVVAVGAYRSTSQGLDRVALPAVEVQGERTPVELPDDADLYLVNDDDLTYATARPDGETRDALFARAAELPTPISRAVAVGTTWDMLTNAEARTSELVESLAAVLEAESSDAVVEPYLGMLGDAVELWAPAADRSRLAQRVTAACRTLARVPSRRRVAMRLITRLGSLEDCERIQRDEPDDIDLQWRALMRKSELATVEERELQRLLDRDPDPDAWVRGLCVRTAAPTTAAKQEFWQVAVTRRTVPVGTFGVVSSAFWRPGQDALLRPYADRYLELLPRLHEGGMIPAMVLTGRLFPLFGIGGDFLQRAEDAAAAAAPVVRRRLLARADEVRRMLAARAAG